MKDIERIVYLGVVVICVSFFLMIIDATMFTKHPEIFPKEEIEISASFLEYFTVIPWWWVVVVVLLIAFLSVAIASFILGKEKITRREKYGLLLVFLTPQVFLWSGFFDFVSAIMIEYLEGNGIFNLVNVEWWWISYHPLPIFISFLNGYRYPMFTDMILSSALGIFLLLFSWVWYYKKFKK